MSATSSVSHLADGDPLKTIAEDGTSAPGLDGKHAGAPPIAGSPAIGRRESLSRQPKDILEQKNELGPKLVIFMVGAVLRAYVQAVLMRVADDTRSSPSPSQVGLPARGKSYVCKKLVRYLSWSGFNTRVFNVGNRRRVMATSSTSTSPPSVSGDAPVASETTEVPESSSESSSASNSPRSSREGADFLAVPKPKRPQRKTKAFAQLLLAKFNSGYHGPVPEPCPSPVVNVPAGSTTHDANFFDPDNPEAQAVREKLALETLDEIIDWLSCGGGKVAIHDATNSTVKRRKALLERVQKEKGIKAMFIESICTDKRVLDRNIQMKLQGPDYKNMPRDVAMRDFIRRTQNYEKAYETISQEEEDHDDLGFIKLINVGKKIIAHNVHGYLESQCVFYLMQMHIKPRTIWLTRHGESEYNVSGRIGGDPSLTPLGQRYAAALARFIRSKHPPQDDHMEQDPNRPYPLPPRTSTSSRSVVDPDKRVPIDMQFVKSTSTLDDNFGTDRKSALSVWTSTLRRTYETVEDFDDRDYDLKRIKFLNEIYAGICENMTYAEIEATYPDEFRARHKGKLVYRYPGPGGESYVDVIERLRPIIIELERMQTNVLVVTHQVVLRTLLSYFIG
ncbi:hypothetical protein HKX48_009012, partial [Thoreauomyces humboldtii]